MGGRSVREETMRECKNRVRVRATAARRIGGDSSSSVVVGVVVVVVVRALAVYR